MSIQEILPIIQSNKWYYIAALTVIPASATWVGNIVLERIKKINSKGMKILVSATIYFFISFIGAALPILYPYTQADNPSGGSYETLNAYRFDMYDDQQIIEHVSNINSDLSHDGKRVEPDEYRAFIYAMNGDYSLYSDPNDLFDTAI